jgi:hypothetical protein
MMNRYEFVAIGSTLADRWVAPYLGSREGVAG